MTRELGAAHTMVEQALGAASRASIEDAVRTILEAIGEDPDREGLLDTPRRVADYLEEVTAGLHRDPARHLDAVFREEHEEMVLVGDITFHSICEHHLVPFFGKAHVVYIPRRGRVVGLSKIARVVEDFARRPQLQERLTSQIADLMMEHLDARGVMVVVEAEHLCMTMRGIKKNGSRTITVAARGVIADDPSTRMEAMALIKSC